MRRARSLLRGALIVVLAVGLATVTGRASSHAEDSKVPRVLPIAVSAVPVAVQLRTGLVFARTTTAPLALDAYLPVTGPTPRPAVVLVHGGGWRGGARGDAGAFGSLLASRGIAAFSIDYRLPPAVATGWPAEVDDVERAIRWVRSHAREFGVDPTRIGIAGSSAGGTLAGVVAASARGDAGARVRVGALFSAPTDLLAMAELCARRGPECGTAGAAIAAAALYSYVGLQANDHPGLWAAASPSGHVNGSSAPMFVVNSSQEAIPVSQATGFGERLGRAKVPHTVDIVPGSVHGFDLAPTVWPDLLEFLRRYL